MKIGIIGAMPQEIEILLQHMTKVETITYANLEIYCGEISSHQIFLIRSGIGKTLASSATTSLINFTKLDMIINTGSAGGLERSLQVGDIVLSSEVVYHDVDVTAFGYKKGQMAGSLATFPADTKLINLFSEAAIKHNFKYHVGLITSGDIFLNSESQKQKIKIDFPEAIAVDMEATSIGHVCSINNLPFIVVRAISDNGDEKASISFDDFLPLAADKSSKLILQTLTQLKI